MRWQAMVMMGVLLAVGCGDDREPQPWASEECVGAECEQTDECLNGGCDYYDECYNGGCDYYDECLNGGCDYYDECLDGYCDYDYSAPPVEFSPLGELIACEAAPVCDQECVIDLASGETDCDLESEPGRFVIDMTQHAALTVRATLTNPEGYAFHLGDSPSNDGHGGDGAEFSNDAEVHLIGNGLYVYGSDRSIGDPGRIRGISDLIAAEGGVLELTVADGTLSVRADQSAESMCYVESSDDLLRLDAADNEGAPDRLWYLGLNQVYSGGRQGSGLDRVELCFH